MPRPVIPALSALVVLLVVLTGCGSSTGTSSASSVAGGSVTVAPAAASSTSNGGTATSTGTGDGTSGGAAAMTASSTGLPGVHEYGLSDADFVDYLTRSQAAIADCMHQAGFEYVPVDVQSVENAQKRVRTDPGYTRKTYKEKWGLAVTTRFDDPVRDVGLGPNLKIWQGLPATDQKAYARALFGASKHHQDFVWLLDEERLYEAGGCTKTGVAKVFPPAMLTDSFVNPKDVLVNSDKRIVAALAAWSKCMKAKGYDYKESQDEIIDEYSQRLDELAQGQDPATFSGSKLAELKKMQQEEIAVSLADLDCQVKNTDDVYRTVEIEVYGRPVSG